MKLIQNAVLPSSIDKSSKYAASMRNKREIDDAVLRNKQFVLPDSHLSTYTYQFGDNLNSSMLHLSDQPASVLLLDSSTTLHETVRNEQNRLVCSWLMEVGYVTESGRDNIPSCELMNYVSHCLSENKQEETRKVSLAKLLLKPLGEYGAEEGERLSSSRQQVIIADWMQYAVLGMPLYNWVISQIKDAKSDSGGNFSYSKLKEILFSLLSKPHQSGTLNLHARKYYKQYVLDHIIPTYTLQFKKRGEQERLHTMNINEPEWSYLHAGLMLLKETEADVNNITMDEMITTGVMLENLLIEGVIPTDYVHYFRFPAMIHYQLHPESMKTLSELPLTDLITDFSWRKKIAQEMPADYFQNKLQNKNIKQFLGVNGEEKTSLFYAPYFDYLRRDAKKNVDEYLQYNPFIRLHTLFKNWKTREVLASQQSESKSIAPRPSIDRVFKEQNHQTAQVFRQVDNIMLAQCFNSLDEEEQMFFEHAEINLMQAEFDVQNTLRDFHLSSAALQPFFLPEEAATIVAPPPVPDSITMLKCTFNGEERIYMLSRKAETGMYNLNLYIHRGNPYPAHYPKSKKVTYIPDYYKLKLHSPLLLKRAKDSPQALIDKLSMHHYNQLVNKMAGINSMVDQLEASDFLLHLIPFYTMITEAQKGHRLGAITAGLFDMINFLPFIGQAVQVGGRFSIAVGEAAMQALRVGIKQATMAQALRSAGKQLVSNGIPHVAQHLTQAAYVGLGVGLLRSIDPGFELLALSGIKGVNALRNGVMKLKGKINGLAPLAEALEKQVKERGISVTRRETKTARLPGFAEEVVVAKYTQQQGRDIWLQINPETGEYFGRKYILDEMGNLELAPVVINNRLYAPKTQGILTNNSITDWLHELDMQRINRSATVPIDLSYANFSRINFVDHFSGQAINFSSAELQSANFSHAYLPKVNLAQASLMQANLSEAKLHSAVLSNANLMQANLSNAVLDSANLHGVNLNGASLHGANLHGAVLTDVYINHADFSGATFSKNQAFTLALPKVWNEFDLNLLLNHIDNGGSLLTSINSIDDKYNELKIKLMLSVIHSLEQSPLDLTTVAHPVFRILQCHPFSENLEITLFADKLIHKYLKDYSVILYPQSEDSIASTVHLITETLSFPDSVDNFHMAMIGRERGNDIWMQINPETKAYFGRKYLRDDSGNLHSAPNRYNQPDNEEAVVRLNELGKQLVNRQRTTQIDLSGVDFSGIHFIDYFGDNSIDLSLANLQQSNFNQAHLPKVNLNQADLSGTKMIYADLTEASLVGANLNRAKLSESVLCRADLMGANFIDAALHGADLTATNLATSNLQRAELYGVNLSHANLINANLNEATLNGAKLVSANLIGTNLGNARLVAADLTEANLTAADFSSADLSGAVLTNVSINKTDFSGATFDSEPTMTVALPYTWDEYNLEAMFNHFSNEGSVLTAIDSINNQYSELKIQLALQVIHSLEQPGVDLRCVALPLLTILGADPFAKNSEINLFIDKLVHHYLVADSIAPVSTSAKFETTSLSFPGSNEAFHVAIVGQAQGHAIWMQINLETGMCFGRQYIQDDKGNLELAAVLLHQGDEERTFELNVAGMGEGVMPAGGNRQSRPRSEIQDTVSPRLKKLKKQLANRKATTVINLSYADFTGVNFDDYFSGKIVDLSWANLSETKLQRSVLTRANLYNTLLNRANLNGADLSHSNLTSAIMVGGHVEQANLTGTNLSNTQFFTVSFIGANLSSAILNKAHLTGDRFLGANLTGAQLINCQIASSDLTNTVLIGANLSDARLKGCTLRGADFSDAILTNVDIINTDFSGAVFIGNETFTLALPSRWSEDELDVRLNYFNNQDSMITSIDSIDNQYAELKCQLALQIIHSLEQAEVDLTYVTLPLITMFGKAPFIKNQQINQFVDHLIGNIVSTRSLSMLADLEAYPMMIDLLLNYFEKHESKIALPETNSVFIETILAVRSFRGNTPEATIWRQRANQLYEHYLSQPDIQQQLHYEQIKDSFGDYNGHVDWSDSDAENYLLLSPTIRGRVLLTSESNLLKMLHPTLNTTWNNVFHFQDGNNLGQADINLEQCYTEIFPFLASQFSWIRNKTVFYRLVETLGLSDELKPLFLEALKTRHYGTKLVDHDHQQTLSDVFSPFLNIENGVLKEQDTLKEQHYEQIIDLYGLASSGTRKKAEHLLSLSTMFTRYSSSAFFGTEHNSPLMLRYYAYALMEKANAIDPLLLDRSVFDNWKNQLLGQNGAFCCTALLADTMSYYAKEHFKDVFLKIQPLAWE